ncbi:MAG: hypothetical protein NTW50_02715 [Candidatus Berkelbacteria bacterium]|nr:hypothetical protein [Candidatus Berkelbacteria bacterium]
MVKKNGKLLLSQGLRRISGVVVLLTIVLLLTVWAIPYVSKFIVQIAVTAVDNSIVSLLQKAQSYSISKLGCRF